MASRPRRWRCRLHRKIAYSTYKTAEKQAIRLPIPGRVYWCPESGGWHITSSEPGEYDRRQAEYLGGDDAEEEDDP